MLRQGKYRADGGNGNHDKYEIIMDVKETEKSYIFNLIEFKTRYGATQMEDFFRKSKRMVLHKIRGGYGMVIWSDTEFTFYPFQAGVPYYFRFIEEQKTE